MLVSLLLKLMNAHKRQYSWHPDVDLTDNVIFATLRPGAYS
jgi:hypothetical protein